MFDFSMTEIGVLFFVAVAVLGPKELPSAMRSFGKFMRQVRKLSGEFQGQINEVMREAELDELRNSVKKITHANVSTEIDKLLDPGGDFAAELARTEQQMQEAMTPPTPVEPAPQPEAATASAQAEVSPAAMEAAPAPLEATAPPAHEARP